MQAKLTDLMERAMQNGLIKTCDCAIAAGHFYGMILGFDIFMARYATKRPDTKRLQANVVHAVDRFLAAYGV
jgi:hypothetical protein